MNSTQETDKLILGMDVTEDGFNFTTSVETALICAKDEMNILEDTIKSVEELKPHADKLDYALAASSGVLCGIIDIFIVGKPGESLVGNITDKWFENRITDFAIIETVDNALMYKYSLEKKYKR